MVITEGNLALKYTLQAVSSAIQFSAFAGKKMSHATKVNWPMEYRIVEQGVKCSYRTLKGNRPIESPLASLTV